MSKDDQKSAAQREADGDITVDIDWLGHTITLPATVDGWDLNVTRAFRDGDRLTAVELLVGADRFAQIEAEHRANNGGSFTNADLRPLGEQIAKLYDLGTSLGE